MTKNEIVRRLREAGINASSTDRYASAYIQDAIGIRATAGWFGFRITCDTQATERRVRVVLERYYNVEISGSVWRLRTKRRLSVMASGGLFPPVPPTPAKSPMYFEAVEPNSTVSLMSMLETAPNLEYSTDGATWQEWQHTTAEGVHTFDTITLGAIGDRVYLRGDNPDGLGAMPEGADMPLYSRFVMTGKIAAGGNIMSLLDKDAEMTEIPAFGFALLFGDSTGENPNTSLTTAAAMPAVTIIGDYGCAYMYSTCTALTAAADMPAVTTIGEGGCSSMYSDCTSLTTAAEMPTVTAIGDHGCDSMYSDCTSLTAAADMPSLTTIGEGGFGGMYSGCTFDMSDDGTTLNFDFPTPPVTAGETTYSTASQVAEWMGNENGFGK